MQGEKGIQCMSFVILDVWKSGKPKLVADAHPWKFLAEKNKALFTGYVCVCLFVKCQGLVLQQQMMMFIYT